MSRNRRRRKRKVWREMTRRKIQRTQTTTLTKEVQEGQKEDLEHQAGQTASGPGAQENTTSARVRTSWPEKATRSG